MLLFRQFDLILFRITLSSTIESMVFSVLVLSYAVRPLFLGPLGELYGRTVIFKQRTN